METPKEKFEESSHGYLLTNDS